MRLILTNQYLILTKELLTYDIVINNLRNFGHIQIYDKVN